MLVTSWPLLDGTLLAPRLLSNALDAPYLGEAAILYNLTQPPAPGTTLHAASRSMPPFVYFVTGLYWLVGAFIAFAFIIERRQRIRRLADVKIQALGLQTAGWCALLVAAITALLLGHAAIFLVIFLVMGQVPFVRAGAAQKAAVGYARPAVQSTPRA